MQKKDLSKIKWGEIYTCDLGNMKGSVQCGVRPVLVVQTNKLNSNSPTVVVAVITSARKREDISSHIFLETNCGLREPSMVMLEQMRTIDKAEELISYVGKVEDSEIIAKIKDGIPSFTLIKMKRERNGRNGKPLRPMQKQKNEKQRLNFNRNQELLLFPKQNRSQNCLKITPLSMV